MDESLVSEGTLRRALCEGLIRPAFQPIYRAPSMTLAGLEVLARWHLPDGGAVPTNVFIAQATRSGLETAIAQSLMHNAAPVVCRLAHTLRQPLLVSFNAGPECLSDPAFEFACASFIAACQGANVSLAVEVTEREPLMPTLAPALWRLKALGTVLVLDDFGTGYATADVLPWLQPNIVKLDRSLTVLARRADPDSRISDALHAVCSVGAIALAEGVENSHEYSYLLRRGVQFFQGYLFGRPVSSQTLDGILRTGSLSIWHEDVELKNKYI